MLRMYKLLIIFSVVLSGLFSPLRAQDANVLFNEGVNAYSEQNYPLAMMKFESIVQMGEESGELYYNMGNCAYKQNDFPLSILYYEKAKLYLPADADLEANLNLANAHILDKIETLPTLFYDRWWNSIIISMSPDGWGTVTLVLLAIVMVMLLVFRFAPGSVIKKAGFYSAIVVFLIFCFTLLVSVQSHKRLTAHDHAIVFKPSVTVKSSPFEDSIDIFVVHEGTKVKLENTEGEWVRIELANGNVGWVDMKTLKVI